MFGERLPLAIEYHRLLATDGSVRGFIGPREVPRLWQRHILNCAVLAEVMPEDASVADIGSGAGLPGIPLAIARPDLHITLIEPLLKRSTFLGEVTEALGLVNVEVVRGRAEEGPVLRSIKGVDVVTSRAVAPLGKLAGWSLPLLKKGGEMIAMKGASVEEELERDAKLIAKAGGGKAQITVIGEQLEEPTTIIRIPKIR
nr:16S rRNA (guanine(527)-N(7))-methyltransferase RsmG [Corynebacterium gerontici]